MFIIFSILAFRFITKSNLFYQPQMLLLFFFLPFITSCDQGSDQSSENTERVYTNADKMPEYKGGSEKLIEYISTEVKYPPNARDMKVGGTVQVSFVVQKDGSVTDAKVEKGVYSELNDEALRVVKSMPKWIPAKHNGKKVAAQLMLPIRFELPKEEDKK